MITKEQIKSKIASALEAPHNPVLLIDALADMRVCLKTGSGTTDLEIKDFINSIIDAGFDLYRFVENNWYDINDQSQNRAHGLGLDTSSWVTTPKPPIAPPYWS